MSDNLRVYLRQMKSDELIAVYYIFATDHSFLFKGTVEEARAWLNKTWTYEIVDIDQTKNEEDYVLFYVKKLGE